MRHALRQLARSPTFTTVAVMTLALGIAANTAIFAIIDELNFKPIANTNLRDVYSVSTWEAVNWPDGLQKPDFATLVAQPPPGVSALAAIGWADSNLIQIPGRAMHAAGRAISGGYSSVFRLRAEAGRWISDDDNVGVAGANVIVISDRLFRQWFDAREEIVGVEHITMTRGTEKQQRRIIGAAAPGFAGDSVDFWIPYGHPPMKGHDWVIECNAARDKQLALKRWTGPCIEPAVSVWMRADTGASSDALASAMTAAIGVRQQTPESPTGKVKLTPARTVMNVDRLANAGLTTLGFAALVFLGACANLANMLYARATEREGEIAVRLALGAPRRAVFQLLMNEALVICGMAAAIGLGLATAALRLFADAFPALHVDYYRQVTMNLSLDWRQFFFAAGAGAIAAVIVGVASLWRASRVSLLTRLAASSTAVVAKTEGRTLRTLLVSVQITAAVLLLIAAGMYLENSGKRFDTRLRFDTFRLAEARIELPKETDEARGSHYFDQVLKRVRSIDGVTSAAMMDALPGGESPAPRFGKASLLASEAGTSLSGTPRRLDAQWVYASPGAVETLALRLLAGRDLQPTDTQATPRVALVTESVAKGLWPGESAVGKSLLCCEIAFPRTVVGVIADPVTSSNRSPLTAPGNFAFLPAAQEFHRTMMVVAQGADARDIVEPIRHALTELDPDVPVLSVAPVDHTQFGGAAAERAARILAGSLGALALGISVLGVYAVVAYFVTKRRREFGLRMALGATRGQVVKLVVDHSVHMVLIGLLPAVLLASWGTYVFQKELVELKSDGLTVWIVVPIVMLTSGILAAYIPARRASRVPPNNALKDL